MNIFVHIHFKNKTKQWNSIFPIMYNLFKFEQNLPKEVVKDVNGFDCGLVEVIYLSAIYPVLHVSMSQSNINMSKC